MSPKEIQMNELLIGATCSILLVALVTALIFSSSFRNDVLGSEGEARILGIISVKGVSIVVLSALFLGGLIYPLTKTQESNKCAVEVRTIKSLVQAKFMYEVEEAADKTDRTTLKNMVKKIQNAVENAEECVNS